MAKKNELELQADALLAAAEAAEAEAEGKPAKTAKKAYKDNISLKEACVELGFLTAERFDEVFHPENMV